jgi:hypothetical protein
VEGDLFGGSKIKIKINVIIMPSPLPFSTPMG